MTKVDLKIMPKKEKKKELLSLTDLIKAQTFCTHNITKIKILSANLACKLSLTDMSSVGKSLIKKGLILLKRSRSKKLSICCYDKLVLASKNCK